MLESIDATSIAVEQTGLEHRVYNPGLRQATVLMVHGRAGDHGVMWIFSKLLPKPSPLVLTPQAFLDDPLGGYSWWPVSDAQGASCASIGDLEPALEKFKYFIDALPQVYGTTPGNLYAIGFSQGAGLVSALQLRHPNLFRGVVLLAGFVPRAVVESPDFVSEGLKDGSISLPPCFIAHGDKDKRVPLQRAYDAQGVYQGYGSTVTLHVDSVGHKVGSSGMRALGSWLTSMIIE